MRGVIDSDPEIRSRAVQFILAAKEVDQGKGWQRATDKILVTSRPSRQMALVREEPLFRYGDLLFLEGRLTEPPVFEGFDYRDYLARQGIHINMLYPKVDLVDEDRGNPLLARVYDLRYRMS